LTVVYLGTFSTSVGSVEVGDLHCTSKSETKFAFE